MRYGENVIGRAVSEGRDVEDGDPADDIERAEIVSSADDESHSTRSGRYKLLLKVLQKINMCFLVLFIGYFAWTIAAKYGYSGIQNGISWNSTGIVNSTLQTENTRNTSENRFIPFHFSENNNTTDPPYHPKIVMPTHRKESKKHRKKGRNRKRKYRKHRKSTYSTLEDYLNLTIEPRKNRNAKVICSDCKIRKRKGRREKFDSGKISPSVLRRILEKVADETLSGARSGTGTISSLFEDGFDKNSSDEDRIDTGWSYDQHWVTISEGDTLSSDRNFYESDDNTSPWAPWSSCSTSCGAGQQERMRKCGTACTEVESMVCVNLPCEDKDIVDDSSTISEFYKWEQEGFVPPVDLPKQEFLDSEEDTCSTWVKCNQKFAQDFITNASLPECPCFFPLIRVKTKDVYDVKLGKDVKWQDASSHSDLAYKPGAFVCMRSSLVPGTATLSVQQCCYDTAYTLLTRGKSAGTPNLISPEISEELHYKIDLLPWIICKGNWIRYNQVLPPDNGQQCPHNPDDQTIQWQREQVTNY